MTLSPGDLIFTGTPEGVILGQDGQTRRWMQEGDVVEIEIGGIGILRNTVGAAC
jgi:2-keto-4-pentenoate hydratase/2-oxohepta-3-ene-1,7-dioic acid hydratase in catechol pathway